MEGTRKRPWSDLPPEILSMIGSRLHTCVDVLRFRSVCSSFRSSIPPLRRGALRFPFRVPWSPVTEFFLRERTVYALETPDGAASGGARWLLKLEVSELGDMRILRVFSQWPPPIASLPHKFPEVLDSLQFRIVEISREYMLEFGIVGETRGLPAMVRAVVHPDCVWTDVDQCLVYSLDGFGQLGYWKYGDEKWSHPDDPQIYDDIVVYQRKVCVVDQLGSVSQIDSSLRLQSFSLPIPGGDHRLRGCWKRRLVVSSGHLYAVDRHIRPPAATPAPDVGVTCDLRAYRLDQQCGRWEEVRSLGNSAFFLCKLSTFAVPAAREVDGCEGDCIYYAETITHQSREKIKVFSLADRRICSHEGPDFSGLFR